MAKTGRPHRFNCRKCERHIDECGELSARGLCITCGVGAMEANAMQLNAHTGEAMLAWRRGVAASVGAILIEDLENPNA